MTTRQTVNLHTSSVPPPPPLLSSSSSSRISAAASSSAKSRQFAHLHSKLASLSANLADLENLLRMTSIQAESIKELGAWHSGLFMAASKVLGEETIAGTSTTVHGTTTNASCSGAGQSQKPFIKQMEMEKEVEEDKEDVSEKS